MVIEVMSGKRIPLRSDVNNLNGTLAQIRGQMFAPALEILAERRRIAAQREQLEVLERKIAGVEMRLAQDKEERMRDKANSAKRRKLLEGETAQR